MRRAGIARRRLPALVVPFFAREVAEAHVVVERVDDKLDHGGPARLGGRSSSLQRRRDLLWPRDVFGVAAMGMGQRDEVGLCLKVAGDEAPAPFFLAPLAPAQAVG